MEYDIYTDLAARLGDSNDFTQGKSSEDWVRDIWETTRERGAKAGDTVQLFNARGRCLAGAKITNEILPGCVFLWIGAWYDPDFEALQNRDRHGNQNVLTHDLRTSSLTQSPAAHSTMIDIRLLEGVAPAVEAHNPPPFSKST